MCPKKIMKQSKTNVDRSLDEQLPVYSSRGCPWCLPVSMESLETTVPLDHHGAGAELRDDYRPSRFVSCLRHLVWELLLE